MTDTYAIDTGVRFMGKEILIQSTGHKQSDKALKEAFTETIMDLAAKKLLFSFEEELKRLKTLKK